MLDAVRMSCSNRSFYCAAQVYSLNTSSNATQHNERIALQDEWRAHSGTVMSYFIAEGVACQHQLLHHTREPQRTPLQQKLPALVVKGSKSANTSEGSAAPAPETELKIAWQYRRCSRPLVKIYLLIHLKSASSLRSLATSSLG